MSRLFGGMLWLLVLLWLSPAGAATGPDYLEDKADKSPLGVGFINYRLPFIKERHRQLSLRSFYMNRDLDNQVDLEDWAGAVTVKLLTDYSEDRFKVGLTAFSGQKLYADDDKGDTGLLQTGHHSYSGLSEAYASFNLKEIAIKAGRYMIQIPYLNGSDIRLFPQTFQGFHGVYKINPTWSVGAGLLTHIKDRTSTGFDALYHKAGLTEKHNVAGVGMIFDSGSGDLAGMYMIHAPEFLNNLYFEFSKRFPLGDKEYWHIAGQYTHQQAIGRRLDGDFEVDHFGIRLSWQRNLLELSAAYTYYSDSEKLRSPWGSIPGFTSVMVKDFNRPGEKAWLVSGSVTLSSWGLPGVRLNGKYITGTTPDHGSNASPDQDEFDLNLEYRPQAPALAGLKVRLRKAWIDQQGSVSGNAQDLEDIRFIVDYEIKW